MSKLQKPISINKAMITVADGVLGAAVLVTIGVFAGHYLDQKLMITPWLSILLPLVGGGLGLSRLVIKAISLEKDKDEPDHS